MLKCRCQVVKNVFVVEVHFYLWPPCEKLSKLFLTVQTPNNLWIRASWHFCKHPVSQSVCLSFCLFICLSVCPLSICLLASQLVSQAVCLCLFVLLSVSFQSMRQSVCLSVHLSILLYIHSPTHLPILPCIDQLIHPHFLCHFNHCENSFEVVFPIIVLM